MGEQQRLSQQHWPGDIAAAFDFLDAYPGSANTLDSLSDGYLAAGDKVKALDFAQKALAALPGDTTASAEFKQQIRESAEGKIRQLTHRHP